MADKQVTELEFIREFGAVVPASRVAHILGYATKSALLKASQRGLLEIPLCRIPHRAGLFAEAHTIVSWLNRRNPAALPRETAT